MLKFKKGALNTEDLVGILVVMFIASILIFTFTIFNVFNQSKKQKQIEVSIEDLNAEYNLNYFLRSQVGDNKIVADIINEAYLVNEYEKLRSLSSQFFRNIYEPTGLSYDILIGEKSLNSIDLAGILMDSVAQLPLISKEIIKVELVVGESRLVMTSP